MRITVLQLVEQSLNLSSCFRSVEAMSWGSYFVSRRTGAPFDGCRTAGSNDSIEVDGGCDKINVWLDVGRKVVGLAS